MPRKNTSSRKPQPQSKAPQKGESPRNFDYRKVGPTSIDGVEASDLPDGGRDGIQSDFGKQAARKLPQTTGETPGGQSGLRSRPDVVESDVRGGRKRN